MSAALYTSLTLGEEEGARDGARDGLEVGYDPKSVKSMPSYISLRAFPRELYEPCPNKPNWPDPHIAREPSSSTTAVA